MLQHYHDQACSQAASLMEGDSITYSVLIKILQGTCTDIFTDHEKSVVCYSCPPWPVWVWCRDLSLVKEIGACLKENFPVEQGYNIILSYELLEQLRQGDDYFRRAGNKMGLLSYRLDHINPIEYPCEGDMDLVREEEVSSLIGVWQAMHMEMEGRQFTPEHCEETIRRMVREKNLFAWRLEDGTIAALTGKGDQAPYSKITSVYTLPRHRRKGYAINLVHGVTKTILDDGLIPILYTDAGYEASNACYQKIGYKLVGRLTSICK